jgi:conjugal transfer pilin signal peptidase TrbI
MRLSLLQGAHWLLTLFLGFNIYGLKTQNPIALLNSAALQGQFIRQLAEHKASKAQVAQATQHFNQSLKQVLGQYAQTHRVVILSQKNVLVGGKEITSEITKELSRVMRGTHEQ